MKRPVIPPQRPYFSESDRLEILNRVGECLREHSDVDGTVHPVSIAQGRNVEEFESAFAQYAGCKHAIAVSSGGSALEAAMLALDVHGKEVLVPTNTFIATPAAVLAAGGRVRLLDIDPHTLSPSTEMISSAIGPETVGVILVHIGGIITPAVEDIRNLCASRGLWLFEDCAHAHGSALNGVQAGNFGIGGAYSFFATKVVTSGEGGMFITNDSEIAAKVRLLRNYGKPDPWVSYSVQIGRNWRLNELAAIVGLVQFRRLDEFIAGRARVAQIYTADLREISGVGIVLPHGRSSWYKYVVVLPAGVSRDSFRSRLGSLGICMSGGVYDLPLHRQPVFLDASANAAYPLADAFAAAHVCLPIYYGMTDDDAHYVAASVADVLREEVGA